MLPGGCSKNFVSDKDTGAVKALAQSYESGNWETRLKIISIICPYDIPQSEAVILKALEDTHSTVRIEALKCIGTKRLNKAKKAVRKLAESEKNNNVRLYAIQALGQYRDPAAAPVFAKGLSNDDWLIREESIKGLLLIDDIIIRQISVSYVLQALNDPRLNVRLATMQNLRIKDAKILKELSAIINNEGNRNKTELLKAALKAINGYILDKNTRDKVISCLTHPEKEIRILALEALKKEKELRELQY